MKKTTRLLSQILHFIYFFYYKEEAKIQDFLEEKDLLVIKLHTQWLYM
jgi:hypothetical protein